MRLLGFIDKRLRGSFLVCIAYFIYTILDIIVGNITIGHYFIAGYYLVSYSIFAFLLLIYLIYLAVLILKKGSSDKYFDLATTVIMIFGLVGSFIYMFPNLFVGSGPLVKFTNGGMYLFCYRIDTFNKLSDTSDFTMTASAYIVNVALIVCVVLFVAILCYNIYLNKKATNILQNSSTTNDNLIQNNFANVDKSAVALNDNLDIDNDILVNNEKEKIGNNNM